MTINLNIYSEIYSNPKPSILKICKLCFLHIRSMLEIYYITSIGALKIILPNPLSTLKMIQSSSGFLCVLATTNTNIIYSNLDQEWLTRSIY